MGEQLYSTIHSTLCHCTEMSGQNHVAAALLLKRLCVSIKLEDLLPIESVRVYWVTGTNFALTGSETRIVHLLDLGTH